MAEAATDRVDGQGGIDGAHVKDEISSAHTTIDDSATKPARNRPVLRGKLRRLVRFLNGFVITLCLSWLVMHFLEVQQDNPIGLGHYGSSFVNWDQRRDEVKQSFLTSWNAYAQNAWGKFPTPSCQLPDANCCGRQARMCTIPSHKGART
jgi:hypothetical protein